VDSPIKIDIKQTPHQAKVFGDGHRYVAWAKGRRCGGTYGAAMACIEWLLDGKRILWVDTIQGNLDRYYERYFAPILSQLSPQMRSWNGQKKTLKVLNGYMDMRSAERPENIEGFAYDYIVVNEAGIIFLDGDYLWYNTLMPMVLDYQARVFLVGTPKGKLSKSGTEHLFYTLFKKGGVDPDWAAYQSTSYDNPLLRKDDIDKLAASLPSAIRRQEIGAEFIDVSADEIFKDSWWTITEEGPLPFTIQQKVLSWDTAFKDGDENDFSVCTYWIKTDSNYYCMDLFEGHLDFPALIAKTQELYDRYSPDVVVVEDKASGQSLIQMFQRTTMPIIPFKVDRDKVSRAIAITPLIEQGKVLLWKADWNQGLINQCSLFPAGEHDDRVDSMSQALLYMSGNSSWSGIRPILSKRLVTTPDDVSRMEEPVYAKPGQKPTANKTTSGFWA
jgi:predicted phage terminase large subunit-like protein